MQLRKEREEHYNLAKLEVAPILSSGWTIH